MVDGGGRDAWIVGMTKHDEAVLEPILASPELPRYVRELHEVLAREHTLRQKFYEDISEQRKAEFINGQVVLHSPVRRRHSLASDYLFALLSAHVNQNQLGWAGHEKLLVVLTRNDYEPDVAFWRAEVANRFAADQMKFPGPDFVAEVLSASTAKVDRGIKFEDYSAHGVREYWLVDPAAEAVEKFTLRGRRFSAAGVCSKGNIASHVVVGFEIPVAAIFKRETHLRVLKKLLA
jgi:Uma2 family endonuclease